MADTPFQKQHMDRVLDRVKRLMLATERFHTLDEIKARLEKVHGLRFAKTEIVTVIGQLRRAGYPLEKRDRLAAKAIAKIPEYRLLEKPAEQLSMLPREPGDEREK